MPLSETEYINSLLASARCKPIDRETEYALFMRYRAGDAKAGNRIVESNLRFVHRVAMGFLNRGLTFSELMQEGVIGLRVALPRHNPDRGIKFLTYAVWWIRQRMLIAIAEQTRIVKLPADYIDLQKRANRARRKLEQKLFREPTLEEIADAASMTEEQITRVAGALQVSESLNDPIGKKNEPGAGAHSEERIDLVRSDSETDSELCESRQKQTIARLMEFLEPVDQQILMRRFGLNGEEPKTLREIGEHLGLSHERIRQRKDAMFPKLRRALERA